MNRLLRSRVPGTGPELSVASVRSEQAGPTVVITANLHGDECTGIGAVFQLRDLLRDRLECGAVHLYPSLNPEGLARGSRELPGVEADPNRAFPGGAAGSTAERHAWRIWRDILRQRPDVLIDLHTDSGAAIPYAIVDRVVKGTSREVLAERCRALADASGLTVLHEYPEEQYVRYRLAHSLPGALINGPGVAAVTLEVGPRGYIAADAVSLAIQATLGVLSHAGLLRAPAPRHATCRTGGPWRRASGPAITTEGVLVPAVLPGQGLAPGSLIGEVCALDGTVRQRLLCTRPAFVVALPERAWVRPGQTCATLGIEDR